jgi:predicted DNA-binding protein
MIKNRTKIKVTLYILKSQNETLKQLSQSTDTSIGKLVRDAIEDYLEKKEKK